MQPDSSILRDLLRRAAEGDEEAASQLVSAYEPEIRRFVRFRLTSPSVRRLIDSVDISQSVLAKFFVIVQERDLAIDTESQLCRLLRTMAGNKIRDHVRRQHAARRDGRRTTGDTELTNRPDVRKSPSETVAERELYDMLLARLSPTDRQLVQMRIDGAPWQDLASHFGLSPEAARKRVTRALDRAAAALTHDASEEQSS